MRIGNVVRERLRRIRGSGERVRAVSNTRVAAIGILQILFALAIGGRCITLSAQQPAVSDNTTTSVQSSNEERSTPFETRDVRGKVICGYQGWFRTPDDRAGYGWRHYTAGGTLMPGRVAIDLWPDVSELPETSRRSTSFRRADGTEAQVFSSDDSVVVDMHFRWMKEYNIDGVMVQRFPVDAGDLGFRASMDRVLQYCFESAAKHDRHATLMYDISGMRSEDVDRLISDWKHLIDEKILSRDKESFFTYEGRPLIALWGCGFTDRQLKLEDWTRLIRFFREDERYGSNAVMLGIPYYWLEQDRDTIRDSAYHEVLASASILSPWAVGRFGSERNLQQKIQERVRKDRAWCDQHHVGYMPVVFPGFSWQNLSKQRGIDAKLDAIPRHDGAFLWDQAVACRKAGSEMVYVAMFDELDEGTAIMKIDRDPPQGESRFLSESNVSSDHYLWLTGQIGSMLRSKEAPTAMPTREPTERK